MYRQGMLASMTPAGPSMPACYYAGNPNMNGCLQHFSVDIVIVSNRATPKWRRVCEACSAWLLKKRLATVPLTCGVASPPTVAWVSASLCAMPLALARVTCVFLPRTKCAIESATVQHLIVMDNTRLRYSIRNLQRLCLRILESRLLCIDRDCLLL